VKSLRTATISKKTSVCRCFTVCRPQNHAVSRPATAVFWKNTADKIILYALFSKNTAVKIQNYAVHFGDTAVDLKYHAVFSRFTGLSARRYGVKKIPTGFF
jgi:hypothetical protein